MTASMEDMSTPRFSKFVLKTFGFEPVSNINFFLLNSISAEKPKDLIQPDSAPFRSSIIIVILILGLNKIFHLLKH